MSLKNIKPNSELEKITDAPVALNATHDVSFFDCGDESLNTYILKGMSHVSSKSSQIFVICKSGTNIVIGYYALSAGELLREQAPSSISRNGPKKIPTITLGRFGISKEFQGKGLGYDLIHDAITRCFSAQKIIGVRALIVHALSNEAKNFYQKAGFKDLPGIDMALYLKMY